MALLINTSNSLNIPTSSVEIYVSCAGNVGHPIIFLTKLTYFHSTEWIAVAYKKHTIPNEHFISKKYSVTIREFVVITRHFLGPKGTAEGALTSSRNSSTFFIIRRHHIS